MPRFTLDTVGPPNAPTAAASLTAVIAGTETQLWDPTLYTNIPATDACAGRVYVVSFGGIYSNRTTTTPASTWTPRFGTLIGGTALGASAAVYTGAALTNASFWGEVYLSVIAAGATGSVVAAGYVTRGNAAGGAGTITQTFGGTVATVDTTINQGLWLGHTWSATNALNTLTIQYVYMKALN